MYCPECGTNAGDANFCAECGADLRVVAVTPHCPECGSDVTAAKFCPDCGADLGSAPRSGAATRRTGQANRQSAPARTRRQTPRQPAPAAPVQQTSKRISPAIIWGAFGVAAVVVILIIVLASGGPGATSGASTTGAQAVQPVSADTSGGYGELVQRANGLYDQGASAFRAKKFPQGTAYFKAAFKVYAAAWKKQSTDSNVGTDYATSLFYARRIDAAIKQVDRVLVKFPGFQTAWFNKGNYLSEKARLAEQSGDSKSAKSGYEDARSAYTKAISIDQASEVGKQAQQRLSQLPG